MNIEIDSNEIAIDKFDFNIFKPVIFMLIVDFIWIIINRKRYNESIKKATGQDIKLSFFGIILSYTSLIFSFIYFSKKLNNNIDITILGICLYAVWNTTNMAIFKDWSYITALIDTIWGGVLFGSTYYADKSGILNKLTDIGLNTIIKSSDMVTNIIN